MRTSLETKFGSRITPSSHEPPEEPYVGDGMTGPVAAAEEMGEKGKLLEKGVPVGYRGDDESVADAFDEKLVYYEYPVARELEADFSKLSVSKNDRVNVCCYMVATNGLKPYLKYLLYKYPESGDAYSDLMVFPFFLCEGAHTDVRAGCVEQVLDYMDNVGGEESVRVMGYKETDHGINVFVQLDSGVYSAADDIQLQKRSTDLWFVLMKEMIDTKSVVNFPVHESVTDFFLRNMTFIFLLDKDRTPYTLPLVVYHGNYYKVITFVAVFGLKKSSVFSSLGPYYYFGTYEKALRYAVWTQNHKPMEVDGEVITVNDTGKYGKGGIVRFAVFPGNMKVFLNRPNDPKDASRLSRAEGVRDEWKSLTARLRDVDGTWAQDYNSVYQGVVLLKDGRKNQRGPHWVLRDYAQQTPLTYHYVDTAKFDDALVAEPTYYRDKVYYVD